MLKDGDPSKQSIQVTIRVRPPSEKELNEDPRACVRVDKQSHTLVLSALGADPKAFTFDSICDGENTQQDIFMRVGINSTERCLEGYNCCIFAYGQTGAGKTFTMMGVNHQDSSYFEMRGLIPRTLEYLFECIDREVVDMRSEYLVKCTFLQIYNEQIIDLLNKTNSNLQLREDLKKGVYVEGLSEETVSRSEEALEILRRGSKGRHVGSTCYNETSSRSHSVFSMLIESKAVKNGIVNVKTRRFHFIDLAGSERTKQSNGERLKEGCSINKSLHVLGMVINSLVESTEGKTRHVNYRDSKLTFLLKDALGGNSKTHLIANISPILISCQETLSTLTFARRVKLIKLNKVSINEDASGNLDSLKSEIRRLKQEIVQLRSGHSRELTLEASQQLSSVEGAPESREISQVLLKNQSKLGLEKILQEYIEESIEKDTKFELELARRDQKMSWLKDAMQQYSKNETHLRMIINLYEEKFKRLRFLEGKLNKKLEELNATEREQIVGHISVEKELLSRQLQHYKELLSETPFIKSLIKNTGAAPDDTTAKQDDTVSAQLAGNLNFLKELKGQLDQTIKERQELNSLIENYSMNKEDQMSPKKRKAIERDFEIKEQQYKDKLEQLDLEAAFLKGTIDETELLLKESVDRQMTLEDKLKDQTSQLEKLEAELHSLQERQRKRYADVMKEKEDCQRDFQQRMTNNSLQQLELRKAVEKHLDSLAEADKKIKRQEEAIQQLIRDNAQMQLRNDMMEKTVQDVEEKAQVDREAVISREETIIRLSGMLEQVKAERDQAISQTESEKQAKKVLKDDLESERDLLTSRYNHRIEALNEQADKLRLRETEALKQLGELKTESESRLQRIQSWEQKHSGIAQQLETERVQLRKRQDEIKQLLQKKANTDSELQTQVNTLSLQSMSLSEQLKESVQKMEELRQNLYAAEEKLFEAQRELEIKGADVQRLKEEFELLRQKERTTQKAREQLDNNLETQKHYLKEEQDKSRRLQLEVDRLKQREKELQQNTQSLKSQVEACEHRLRESVNAGTKISEQLRELTDEFERKQKTLEKVRESHEREVAQLRQQLDSQKEKSLAHEAYMKKVFEECMTNKDKIAADLKSQNGLQASQLLEESRKTEDYKLRLRDSEARAKQLAEMVAEKDSSIIEVNDQLLLLRDEIERMKNIFEQKMEERENSYNEFIDKKNEYIDKCEVDTKRMTGQLEETKLALEAQILFGQQKSQSITELTDQVNGLESAMQKIAVSMNLQAEGALESVDRLVQQLLNREKQTLKEGELKSVTISQLNQTITKLQQDIVATNGELKHSKERNKQLEGELSHASQQHGLALGALQQEIDRQKLSKGQLSNQLSHAIGMLNTEMSGQQTRFEAIEHRLTKRVGELEKQLTVLDEHAALESERAKQYIFKAAELQEKLVNTNLELQTIQSQFNESEVKVRQLTDALEEKELQLSKNKTALSHRVRELQFELQTTQRTLEDEIKLKEACKGSDGEKERVFNLRIEKLKSDNEELRGQVTSLYGQLSELQAKINKFEVRQINITKQNSELESERRQLNNRITQLSEDCKEKQSLLHNLQKEKERADTFAETVNEYKEKLQKQLQQSEQLEIRLNNERFEEMKRLKADFMNEIHKSNSIHEQLEQQNMRLREEAQQACETVERLQQSADTEREDLRQHVAVLEQECDGLRSELTSMNEKCEQLDQQAGIAIQLERQLRQERTSTVNLKKLIDNLERQKMQLEAELEDKDESQKRLLAKMTRVEQAQPKLLEDRKSIMKTNDLLERSRMELLEYKQQFGLSRKTVEENNRVFKKLKAEMQAKEENFVQMHEKAEEFCRNQELKVASIRGDYEKLENEHQLLIREKERLESLREENENLQEELNSYKAYQTKADRRLEQLQQTVQSLSSEAAELRDELESYRRQPTRVGSDNGMEVKLQYINKLKEENSLLKRQKQILSDRLNQECEEKLRLKTQLGHHEKKLTKDIQNRTSLNILESMSNNVEVALKIELEKKIGEIKYLHEGYGELCAMLGIKRFPQNKMKGPESTVGVIMTQVQNLVQELNQMKGRLRDKERQLDSKNVHYQVINKQYNHLKLKILEAKGVKEQSYQKKPSTAKLENTFTSYRPSFNENYSTTNPQQDLSTFEELKQQQQQQLRNREVSRNRKPY